MFLLHTVKSDTFAKKKKKSNGSEQHIKNSHFISAKQLIMISVKSAQELRI